MQNHARGEVAVGHDALQQIHAEPLLSRGTWSIWFNEYLTAPALEEFTAWQGDC